MRIGKLRHPVKVYQEIDVKDGAGSTYKEWEYLLSAKMAYEPFYGTERNSRGVDIDPQQVRFRCRYDPRLFNSNNLRFVFKDINYTITGVPQLMNGKFRELYFPATRESSNGE